MHRYNNGYPRDAGVLYDNVGDVYCGWSIGRHRGELVGLSYIIRASKREIYSRAVGETVPSEGANYCRGYDKSDQHYWPIPDEVFPLTCTFCGFMFRQASSLRTRDLKF